MSDCWDEMVARAKMLPPPTAMERFWQRVNFAYGNLAASTNHRQTWEQVAEVAVREVIEGLVHAAGGRANHGE